MFPGAALRRITEQVHYDCTPADGLIHGEEVGAGNPPVLLRLFPASTVLSHTNNDVEAVVAEVQALAVAL